MPTDDFENPDLTISALLARWPAAAPVFFANTMQCVGCLANRFHTISDACLAYGIDEAQFRRALHPALNPHASDR
jgi:hybrid cluster-associated redox disulfide protein